MELFFILAGENSMCGFPFFPFLFVVKKDLKIGFFKHGVAVKTRRSVLIYIYIIYKRKKII